MHRVPARFESVAAFYGAGVAVSKHFPALGGGAWRASDALQPPPISTNETKETPSENSAIEKMKERPAAARVAGAGLGADNTRAGHVYDARTTGGRTV